jgi:AbrB family looped-hinge helix DNA binding protein
MKLRVGRKGYIILPKKLRDLLGLKEGDELVVEVKDGILLKPTRRKVDLSELRRELTNHINMLKGVEDGREPKPGELSETYLEEEFN